MVDRLRHIDDRERIVYDPNQYIVSRVDKRTHEERDWRVKMMKPTNLSSIIGRTTAAVEAAVDDQEKGRRAVARRAAGTVIEEREREQSGALIARSHAYTIKAHTRTSV